jgi:hypothetical protein
MGSIKHSKLSDGKAGRAPLPRFIEVCGEVNGRVYRQHERDVGPERQPVCDGKVRCHLLGVGELLGSELELVGTDQARLTVTRGKGSKPINVKLTRKAVRPAQ